jgi:putative endonuclease
MTKHIELGMKGEDMAERYLLERGYKVLERNVRMKCGEIDIVSIRKDGTLVFVEVKTMKESYNGLSPEDQMSNAKRMKFERVASIYANQSAHVKEDKGWQLDLLSIVIRGNDSPQITHYENI